MTESKNYQDLLLAALFHDIGKFWQRTRDEKTEGEVRDKFGESKHEHWGAYFLENIIREQEAARYVRNHHKPKSGDEDPFDYILALSDWISGEEREDREEKLKKPDPAREPLISIFSQIRMCKETPVQELYLRLCGETLEKSNLFPVEEKEEPNYRDHWKEFEKALEMVKTEEEFDRKVFKYYHLLEAFTSTVPSAAHYSKADISLFDHLKTTCAIAACLYQDTQRKTLGYDQIEEVYKSWRTEKGKEIEAFTLLGGDITGIQDYIFSVSSKGAAKGLKGRSLYLNLLPEVIAKFIIKKFNVPILNILFCGGGHFFLLLPLLQDEEIEELRQEVNDILFRAHKGTLSMVIAGVRLSIGDFGSEKFSERWVEVGKALQSFKKEKFKSIIQTKPDNFFGPHKPPQQLCDACGLEEAVEKAEREKKCTFCESFEGVAKEVIKEGVVLSEKTVNVEPREFVNFLQVFNAFGLEVGFSLAKGAYNYTANNRGFWKEGHDGFVYLPNHAARKGDQIKDFDELAEGAKGKERWGILRGDVDNLGKIFSRGFKFRDKDGQEKNLASISRTTSLSRNLHFFFSYWLNEICKEERFKDNTYVIYAGGDDFFIVGSWDVLPELAMRINEDFRRFTGNNPHITLSCAIYIAPSAKYPLYKAAENCGTELEEKAKAGEKDKLVFLGNAFGWGEFKDIKELKEKITTLLTGEKKVSNALLQTIYSGFKEKEQYEKGVVTVHRIWRLIYGLTRLARRHKAEIKEVENTLIPNKFNLEEGGLYAARWAELELQ